MFLASLPMMYTFCNLFILQKFALMLVTLTKKPFFLILSYKNKSNDTCTINFVKHFLNSILDIQS